MAKETLSFWTTGEAFTGMMDDFFQEGRFEAVIQSLLDGGLPDEMILPFLKGELGFGGDTREGDGTLHTIALTPEKEWSERLYWAINNCALNGEYSSYNWPQLFRDVIRDFDENDFSHKNLKALFPYVSLDTIRSLVWKKALTKLGWKLNPKLDKDRSMSGAIIPTGDYIQCDYAQHDELYGDLCMLGLVPTSRWIDCDVSIHISSGDMHGTTIHAAENGEGNLNENQIATLVKYKKHLSNPGAFHSPVMEILRNYFIESLDQGGKYGHLVFLKYCYPHIKTPTISKKGEEWNPTGRYCLRTSPKYSLPGLLTSKFDPTTESIKEVEADFEKYKDVVEGNKLDWFFQEYLPGVNGVAHYIHDQFSYSASEERGAVVDGEEGKYKLGRDVWQLLKAHLKEIATDLKENIQVEFVVTPEGELYIVQLRILKNISDSHSSYINPERKNLVTGKGFSRGLAEDITADDVLVVMEDAASWTLIGKKALIVTKDVEFSHILCLSNSLRIPSMYGTGDVTLPSGKFTFNSYSKDAFIY